MSRARHSLARPLALGSLLVVAIVVGVLALRAGHSYTLHAEFSDAGQLVPGDLVEVAGRPVGKISQLSLSDNGLADAELKISDGAFQPLHTGTIATIRAVGLSGVANRFVELSPGPPNTPVIRDGGRLALPATNGIVDLDVLLDSLDPPTRAALRNILSQAAQAAAAPTANQVNGALALLDPALSQTAALGRELVVDQAALSDLVTTTATVSSTLAARRGDLADAITTTATTLGDIAAQRAALGDALARAPAVLGQATAVLGRLEPALAAVNPALVALRPAAPRIARLLRQVAPIAHNAIPALKGLRSLLPSAEAALAPLPALATQAVPALASGTTALTRTLPLLAGLRPYTPDIIGGLFNGFGGSTSGYYDANGHYARVQLELGQAGFPSLLGLAPAGAASPAPSLTNDRTGLTARCPGAAVEPAPDKSNPWLPADAPGLCNPQQNHR